LRRWSKPRPPSPWRASPHRAEPTPWTRSSPSSLAATRRALVCALVRAPLLMPPAALRVSHGSGGEDGGDLAAGAQHAGELGPLPAPALPGGRACRAPPRAPRPATHAAPSHTARTRAPARAWQPASPPASPPLRASHWLKNQYITVSDTPRNIIIHTWSNIGWFSLQWR
jgi:hypothetical protein